jgi:hypothetical protein
VEADFEHLEVHVHKGEKVVKLQEQNADPAVQVPSAETGYQKTAEDYSPSTHKIKLPLKFAS